MTYYNILGVSVNATTQEIKEAYRQQVKRYHPDRNKTVEAHAMMTQINEAYDVLSNPTQRAWYDSQLSTPTPTPTTTYQPTPEDAREAWRRKARQEYIRKKKKEEEAAKARHLKRSILTHKILYWLCVPSLILALALVFDHLLPAQTYQEVATNGWQQRNGSSKYGASTLQSFMETEHFTFSVPHSVHLNYDYYAHPARLTIKASPLFNFVKQVSIPFNGDILSWVPMSTRYERISYLIYALIAFAIVTLAMPKYSIISYLLSQIHALALLICMLSWVMK